ncbi:hypothetical protein [Noviherbaspirillum soli]|uniref:hypothetical protein n=1 Tax=Noviherbaspirillum soli TaxID=1064518 RepID=UPI00188D3D9C|nr:hypothetical protein [Noviherbaspirillum soli]
MRTLRLAARVAMATAALGLSACSTVGGLAGTVAGIATGSFTSNPAIGIAVSVSVKAATDAGMKNLLRSLQQDEQDEIAALAGMMREGEVRPWQVRHKIPYGNNQGDMQIIRSIITPLANCKEVMFTVNDANAAPASDGTARPWFAAHVCLQESGWKWASAEPAVERWGALH